MKESFNANVESITHDSDPKYLRFFQVDRATGVETLYGGNLAAANNPTPVAPIIGPRISALTGGGAPALLKLGDLTTGIIDVNVGYTDSTTDFFALQGTDIAAAAIAQGHGADTGAELDITAMMPPTPIGKMINTISATVSTAFGPGLTSGSVLFQVHGSGGGLLCVLGNIQTAGGSTSNGPGMGIVYQSPANTLTATVSVAGTIGPVLPNTITLDLEPPSPVDFDHLLTGEFSVRFHTTLGNYSDPWDLTAANLTIIADSLGVGDQTAHSFDFPVGSDIFGVIAGQTIDAMLVTRTTAWTGNKVGNVLANGPTVDSDSWLVSYFNLRFDSGGGHIGIVDNLVLVSGETSYPCSVVVPVDNQNFTVDAILQTVTTPVQFNVAASDILAGATVPQLASQSTLLSPIQLYNSVLTDYFGWTVRRMTLSATPYGPITLSDLSTIQFAVTGTGNPPSFPTYNLKESQSGYINSNGLLSPDAYIAVGIDLYPKDTAEVLLPLLMSEIYELRQRNIPAFRLILNQISGGAENPSVYCQMLASQGPIGNAWQWTPIPVDMLLAGSAAKEVETPQIFVVGPNIPNMPLNYGGIMLTVPKEYVGPWNYLRLWFYAPAPIDGERQESTLDGYIVQVQANAREL